MCSQCDSRVTADNVKISDRNESSEKNNYYLSSFENKKYENERKEKEKPCQGWKEPLPKSKKELFDFINLKKDEFDSLQSNLDLASAGHMISLSSNVNIFGKEVKTRRCSFPMSSQATYLISLNSASDSVPLGRFSNLPLTRNDYTAKTSINAFPGQIERSSATEYPKLLTPVLFNKSTPSTQSTPDSSLVFKALKNNNKDDKMKLCLKVLGALIENDERNKLNDFSLASKEKRISNRIAIIRQNKNKKEWLGGNCRFEEVPRSDEKNKVTNKEGWMNKIKKPNLEPAANQSSKRFQIPSSDKFFDNLHRISSRSTTQIFGEFGEEFARFDEPRSHRFEDTIHGNLNKIDEDDEIIPPEFSGQNIYEEALNSYLLEEEEGRRKKLEKAVEKYVEEYIEKQLGEELIKNYGVPKKTIFEFATKNGPIIKTITTTIAKITKTRNPFFIKQKLKGSGAPEPEAPKWKDYKNTRRSSFRKNSNNGRLYSFLIR